MEHTSNDTSNDREAARADRYLAKASAARDAYAADPANAVKLADSIAATDGRAIARKGLRAVLLDSLAVQRAAFGIKVKAR